MITYTSLTYGSSSSTTSAVTAPINPSSNKLLIVGITGNAASQTAPTLSGCNITWTMATSAKPGTTRITSLWQGISSNPTSGSLTISYGAQSQNTLEYNVVEFDNVDINNPLLQANVSTLSTTASTITVNMSSFASANNATYGLCMVGTNKAITSKAGWTDISISNLGTCSFRNSFINSNDTTPSWTWDNVNASVYAIAVELKELITSTDGILCLRLLQ